MGYAPTALDAVAVVVRTGLPTTPLVASVSPLMNPLKLAVSGGRGSPRLTDLSSAVTVSTGALTLIAKVASELVSLPPLAVPPLSITLYVNESGPAKLFAGV